MNWEVVASLAAGLAIAGGVTAWPRQALICLGLVSLLLGMLGLSTLKVISIPALVAVLGGIGLIGFGRLVGAVEELLKETRIRTDRDGTKSHGASTSSAAKREPVNSGERIEPRL